MTDRFNLEGLRYVNAVAQTASFSAAARSYGVTQPALSNGVAKIEEQLGAKLFNRTSRGVSPTAFGTQILPLIENVLQQLDTVSTEAKRLTSAQTRDIHVGVSRLIDPQLVARAYDAMRELPEPRELILREGGIDELRPALTDGEIDMILTPAVLTFPGSHQHIVHSEPIRVVDSRASTSPTIELEEIANDYLILVQPGCVHTTFVKNLYASRGLTMNIYPGNPISCQAIEQWAILGLGTAVLPLSQLSSSKGRSRQLLDQGKPVMMNYEAVWPNNSHLAPIIDQLVEMLARD